MKIDFLKIFLVVLLSMSFGKCFTTTDYESKVKYKNFEVEKIKINNVSDIRKGSKDFESTSLLIIPDIDSRIPIVIHPEGKLGLKYKSDECFFNASTSNMLISGFTLYIIPFFTGCKRTISLAIYFRNTPINRIGFRENYTESNIYSPTVYLVTFPIQILWRIIGDPFGYNTEAQVRNDLLVLAYPDLLKFSKMSESEMEAYIGSNNESKNSETSLPKSFNDIVVLKNGDILEGVHTKVTPTTLEVTESNGKKTIYKKSQVLSVKKK